MSAFSYRFVLFIALFVLGFSSQLRAEESAAEATLDEVVVFGAQPGPGLWRVAKDDHVLWVLGTLSPLPKKMQWISREVEQTIAESQEVILPPGVAVDVKIGFFGGLFLLPSALSARKNPDKAKLVDVVPAEMYARWLPLKKKYLGRGNGIEKQRPIMVAQKLYSKAIKRTGLSTDNVVVPLVKKTAKKHKVLVTSPVVNLTLEDPKQAVKELAKTSLDDLDCFSKTMERLETDLTAMRARANAWATGDIEALRQLPYTDQNQACTDAMLKAGFAQSRGFSDLQQRARDAWLAAAETALGKNTSSFALLPMAEMLKPDGLIARLKERGYEVDEP